MQSCPHDLYNKGLAFPSCSVIFPHPICLEIDPTNNQPSLNTFLFQPLELGRRDQRGRERKKLLFWEEERSPILSWVCHHDSYTNTAKPQYQTKFHAETLPKFRQGRWAGNCSWGPHSRGDVREIGSQPRIKVGEHGNLDEGTNFR